MVKHFVWLQGPASRRWAVHGMGNQVTCQQQQELSSICAVGHFICLSNVDADLPVLRCVFFPFNRNVKIQALNDSKYIGICVYIVVLTSVLAVSLVNLISERVTISFLCVTTLILTSTTMTLCLLFLPKVSITQNTIRLSSVVFCVVVFVSFIFEHRR